MSLDNHDKIIVVTQGYHPPWNWGEINVLKKYISVFKDLGLDPIIISNIDKNRFNTRLEKGVIYIIENDDTKFSALSLYHLLKQLHIYNKVRAVHISGIKDMFFYPFSVINSMSNNLAFKPIFIHSYGQIPRKKMNNLGTFRHYLKFYIGSLFGGRFLTTSLEDYYILKDSVSEIFYLPPLIAPCDSRSIDVDVMLTNGWINENDIILLYIGHLRKTRFPYHEVLKFMKKLYEKKLTNIKMLIIAPVTKENMIISQEIRNISTSYKIRSMIKVIVRNIDEKTKLSLYRRANFFLFLPNQLETMDPPLTVLEALGCGNVVITTKYRSLKYIIKDYYNGFFVNSPTHNELFNKVVELIENSTLYEFVSNNAKLTVKKLFSYEFVVKKLINIYKSLSII